MVEQRICYVGGLAEEMTEEALRAAFAPFGEIRECKIPTANKDSKSSKHRGFGFVEFEEEEDAKAAIDNMHESECFGRTLTVNHSRAQANRQPDKAARPIWADQFLHVQKLQAAGLQKELAHVMAYLKSRVGWENFCVGRSSWTFMCLARLPWLDHVKFF